MVWLTSLDVCCRGCLESCSIFLLDSRNMGTIFCVVIGFTVVMHAVQRSDCVWASTATVTTASAWCVTSLIVLS
jgi:hypothetical protein